MQLVRGKGKIWTHLIILWCELIKPWSPMASNVPSGCSVTHDNSGHSIAAGLLCGFTVFPSGGPFLWLIQTSIIEQTTGMSNPTMYQSTFSTIWNVFYFCLYPKNLAHSRCSILLYWTQRCNSDLYSVFHFSSPPRYLLPSETSSSMGCPSDVSEAEPTPSLASARHFLFPIAHSTSIFLLGKILEPPHSL